MIDQVVRFVLVNGVTRQLILDRARTDHGEGSPTHRVAARLLEVMRPETTAVTVGSVSRLCAGLVESRDLYGIMLYLASDRVPLFEVVFAVLDETARPRRIAASEIRAHLQEESRLVSPVTGEAIEMSDVVVFFEATPVLRGVLA